MDMWLSLGFGCAIIGVAGVVGGLSGAAASFIFQFWHDRSLVLLSGKVSRLENTFNGVDGRIRRAQNDERLEEAMAEGVGILRGEGTDEEKKAAAIQLLAKYPDVAMKIGKRLLKQGIKP